MKLLESYANNCSIEIKNRPEIVEKYFPLPLNKYITLQTKSGMPAKDYDWFQECVDLLIPILNEKNIQIVWLGKDDSQPLRNVIDLRNRTSFGQSCYIIKRSSCHLSVDTWGCHYAAAEEVPLVALYGSTTIENHSPYYINNEKAILLQSHRKGNKASFSREENPKTVNFINPEDVVKSVCKLLEIEFNYPYKTIEIGNAYFQRAIESVPDSIVNISNLGISSLIVRMDYLFDENNLMGQLHHCPCTIVTDKPINIEILNKLRPNVIEIIYNIKETPTPNPQFVKKLFDNKIQYRLVSFLTDEEVNKYRLDFMDWGIIDLKERKKPDSLTDENINIFYYKTNKFLLSKGKIYQSLYDCKNGRPINNLIPTPQQLIKDNLDILWADKEYSYYLQKTS